MPATKTADNASIAAKRDFIVPPIDKERELAEWLLNERSARRVGS